MNMFKGKVAFAAALLVGASLVGSSVSAASGYGGSSEGGKGGISGGGGSGCAQTLSAPAEGFRVRIASENGSVYSRLVQLTINGGNARRMAISNDAAFTNASLIAANGSMDWTLSEGEGSKTVYVRFYDECGISSTPVSATVVFHSTRPTAATTTVVTTDDEDGQVLGERITKIDELIARLRYGRRAADVRTLQTELVNAGLMPRGWVVTSYYGPVTLAAVTSYVDAHNGNLDEMIARLTFGQTHPDVRRLSRQLIAGGFMPRGTRISSYYGVAVRAAVARYQASR
jgi:hypothetical protein